MGREQVRPGRAAGAHTWCGYGLLGFLHAPATINNPTSLWELEHGRMVGPADGPTSDRAGGPARGLPGAGTDGLGWFHAPDPINNPTSSWGLEDGDGALDEDTGAQVGGRAVRRAGDRTCRQGCKRPGRRAAVRPGGPAGGQVCGRWDGGQPGQRANERPAGWKFQRSGRVSYP